MTEEDKMQKNEMKDKDNKEHKIDGEQKNPELKDIEKKPEQGETKPKKYEKPKKTEAVVNAKDVPISTKQSAAICRFIKGKKIENAIADLEQVAKMKRPVPMRGEIPHRRGKGMMSGRFPQKAAREFIVLLRSLGANASYNGMENPVVIKAIANIGARPFGRYGIRRKRTHVTLIAKTVGGKNESM